MNILFVGDIFARPGRRALAKIFPDLKKRYALDFTIANGENAAGGFGLTRAIADELLDMGVDVLTSGNHIWNNNDISDYLENTNKVLRPLNYPPSNPGRGFCTVKAKEIDAKVSVINVIGRVFMGDADCPFRAVDEILPKLKEVTPIVIVDVHAEATSEKKALGSYLDGKVTLVAGTHTHIQTADEQVFPGGTAYITDAGMTGAHESIIGVKKEIIIQKFLNQRSARFEPAKGGILLNAVVVEVDEKTGKAKKITRIYEPVDLN